MAEYLDNIDGWLDLHMRQVYADAVAKAVAGDTLVELGCWKGRSFCYLLDQAKKSGKQLNIVAVDHFLGSVGEPPMQHEAAAIDIEWVCRHNADRIGYPYTIRRMASPAAAGQYANNTLALVFIDASHDYASVKADIGAWQKKIKPGCLIAGHDIGMPGVNQAVRETLPGYTMVGSCWTWLQAHLELDEPPMAMAAEAEAEPETVIEPAPEKKKSIRKGWRRT